MPRWAFHRLDNPREQVGMPMIYKWAVTKNGAFFDAFILKRSAKAFVDTANAEEVKPQPKEGTDADKAGT